MTAGGASLELEAGGVLGDRPEGTSWRVDRFINRGSVEEDSESACEALVVPDVSASPCPCTRFVGDVLEARLLSTGAAAFGRSSERR